MNKKQKNLLLKGFNLILTALLLVFAYGYISRIVQQADFENIAVNWTFLVLSLALFTVGYVLMSIHWLFSCWIVNPSTTQRQVVAFFASQPYKYMPTSIFTFSSRAVYAKKLGLTLKQGATAQVFENSSMLIANFGLFVVLYTARINIFYSLLIVMAITGVLYLFSKQKDIQLQFRGRQLNVVMKQLVKMYCVASLGWFTVGLTFVAFNAGLGLQINFLDFLAANTLAFSLSLLAFFAPGGIGVREVVYDFFLVSGVAIIFWRMFTFILDSLFGLIAILAIKFNLYNVRKL